MNSQEINDMLMQLKITKKYFGGIFPSDRIPKRIPIEKQKEDKYFIVNLDPAHKPGSHWVVCFVKKGEKPDIYFDSYGFPPLLPGIRAFMGQTFIYNEKKVQHTFSTACGQWCIFFVLHQLLGKSLKSFSERFSDVDLLKNDHEINAFINKVFRTKCKVLEKRFLVQQICKSLEINSNEIDFYDAIKNK